VHRSEGPPPPDGATLVNTGRGGLVDHEALVDELSVGRIWAVLDTTDPQEPLPPDSPLDTLPNVVLTPHMAGSVGNELFRLGDHAVEQAIRLHRGLPLDGVVTRETIQSMACRLAQRRGAAASTGPLDPTRSGRSMSWLCARGRQDRTIP
jgi:hypothetical protein